MPLPEFFDRIGIVETQHGLAEIVSWESSSGDASDTLRRRVWRNQLGIFALQLFEFAKQLIKVIIGDRGLVEDLVAVLVVANLFAKRLNLCL
jgi:hypothetical protein